MHERFPTKTELTEAAGRRCSSQSTSNLLADTDALALVEPSIMRAL